MRVIDVGDKVTKQTEELSINGASLVFYSVRVLSEPIDNTQLSAFKDPDGFERIQSNQGYIEKILNLNETNKADHMSFKCNDITTLPPFRLADNDLITPRFNHYVTLYEKRIILVQSVMMIDVKKITKYEHITEMNQPISTSDLLTIIHIIKNKEEDCCKKLNYCIEKIIDRFISLIKKDGKPALFPYSADRNEQCLSVQIWDIASLPSQENLNGIELSKHYEVELSAILSCYNEHFTKKEVWKNQSANQVHKSVLARTDVLNDHQVLLSEWVCVEISQVNRPAFREISANRLFIYGYDSTSIFLWGYLVMISAGYEVCDIKAGLLYEEMRKIVSNHPDYNSIKHITVDKQQISREIEQYRSLYNLCIETRHKKFVDEGLRIKDLVRVQEHAEEIFIKIKELSELVLEAATSQTGEEINALLNELKTNNEKQGEASSRLAILALVLAFSAVIPLTEFIAKIIPAWNNPAGMLLILSATGLLLAVVAFMVLKARRKKTVKN